ncbi:MAG: hypothetical protein A2X23_01925 [Chloroflexi bacterium GWC2_73_18]|nr:MAG: hypothetical protein A2X23_01925 [Chloroflexi bacterium GWC2_73_18]
MLSVKVSTKHQIVVPSEVRRQLGIKAGDRLEVRIEDGDVVLHPRPPRVSERLRGLFRGMYDGKDAVEYVRELREESERWRENDG